LWELKFRYRLLTSECISHSPAYLPNQACNQVTPSRLLLLAPGVQTFRGFFMRPMYERAPARDGGVAGWGPLLLGEEALQHLAGLIFAIVLERREWLHGRSVAEFLFDFEYGCGRLPAL